MTLLSLDFISLAIALVLWVRFVRGPLRLAGFVLGSVVYAASFLSPIGRISTSAFLLAGFVLARVVRRWPQYTTPAVVTLIAAFVYLRGYDVVIAALPKGFWSTALATAGLSYLLFKVVHVVVDSAGEPRLALRGRDRGLLFLRQEGAPRGQDGHAVRALALTAPHAKEGLRTRQRHGRG